MFKIGKLTYSSIGMLFRNVKVNKRENIIIKCSCLWRGLSVREQWDRRLPILLKHFHYVGARVSIYTTDSGKNYKSKLFIFSRDSVYSIPLILIGLLCISITLI
jgi:hypothetical protein